jgi:diguanylate cyclase (GGDEF)-like protein
MMALANSRDSDLELHERLRKTALYIGGLGLLINLMAYAGLYALGNTTPMLTAEVLAYAVAFLSIFVCGFLDIHVRAVLFYGLLAIYAVFWIAAFAYAWRGDPIVPALPLILFVPLLLMISLPHRLLFFIAPLQFVAVFFYTRDHALPALGVSWPAGDQLALSLAFAGFSGAIILVFALLSIERARTDRKLTELVAEKDLVGSTDSLTGLFNRRAFMALLEAQWPPSEPLSIAFIDLDHFKPLNDQYGHAMGDFVLREVASRLRGLAGACAVARLGGDEFAVCCIGKPPGESDQSLAGNIHDRVAAEFHTEIGPISMRASVGYAVYDSEIGSLSKMLRAADAAMRRAKSNKTGWVVFDHSVDGAALATTSIEFELKSAVHSGQIRAAVQPIARAPDLRIVELELLARWVDSGFDTDPSPAQFVPIAEKLGLLNEILWVTLDEALAMMDVSITRLAINVSPAQLLASDFLESLQSILARHDVPPSAITLEVTEEVVFRNLDKNVEVLNQARSTGMSVALDDFGTGYSSLAMLDALPLDKLKIDRTLITNARHSERSVKILSAAISLAQQLDLVACVEGVESAEELNIVLPMGAQQVQGYWIGRPYLVSESMSGDTAFRQA